MEGHTHTHNSSITIDCTTHAIPRSTPTSIPTITLTLMLRPDVPQISIEFNPTLEALVKAANGEANKVLRTKKAIDEVKGKMMDNIDKAPL